MFFFQLFKGNINIKNSSLNDVQKKFKILINIEKDYNNILNINKSKLKEYLKSTVDIFYITDVAQFKFFLSVSLAICFAVLLGVSFNFSLNIVNYKEFSALLIILVFNIGNLIKQLTNSLRFIEFTNIHKIQKIFKKNK